MLLGLYIYVLTELSAIWQRKCVRRY